MALNSKRKGLKVPADEAPVDVRSAAVELRDRIGKLVDAEQAAIEAALELVTATQLDRTPRFAVSVEQEAASILDGLGDMPGDPRTTTINLADANNLIDLIDLASQAQVAA